MQLFSIKKLCSVILVLCLIGNLTILTSAAEGTQYDVNSFDIDLFAVTVNSEYISGYYITYSPSPSAKIVIRSQPNITSNMVTSAEAGRELLVTNFVNGYGYVSYDGYYGWINMSYMKYVRGLSQNEESSPIEYKTGTYRVATSGGTVYLRKTTDNTSAIVSTLPANTLIVINKFSGDYGYSISNNATGNICGWVKVTSLQFISSSTNTFDVTPINTKQYTIKYYVYDAYNSTSSYYYDSNWKLYSSETAKEGSYITGPSKGNPTSANSKVLFDGWYTNKFGVGERFNFNTTPVTKDMSLYVKWKSNDLKTITYSGDIFTFDNTTINHKITGAYKDLIYKGRTLVERAAIKIAMGTETGICFGMAAFSALAKSGKTDLSYFGINSISEIPEPYNDTANTTTAQKTAYNILNYYWLTQWKWRSVFNAIDCNWIDDAKNNKALYTKVKNSKYPVIMYFNIHDLKNDKKGTYKFSGTHAILAYGVTDNPDGTHTIDLWDNNESRAHSSMTLSSDFKTKTYAGGNWYYSWTRSGETHPAYRTFTLNALTLEDDISQFDKYPLVDYLKQNSSKASNSLNPRGLMENNMYLKTNYQNFIITKSDGSFATVENGISNKGTLDIRCLGAQNAYGSELQMLYTLPLLSDNETYTILPDKREESVVTDELLDTFTTELVNDADDGFIVAVSADNTGKIVFNNKGEVSTKFNEPTYQEITTGINNVKTSWYNTKIAGKDTGFTACQIPDKLVISSENTVKVDMEVCDDYNTIEFNDVLIPSNSKVNLREDEKRLASIVNGNQVIAEKRLGYSVSFNTGISKTVDSLTDIPSGIKILAPAVENEGYVLEGWYTSDNFLDDEKWDFGQNKITDNITLYARWQEDPSYWSNIVYCIENGVYQTAKYAKGNKIISNIIPKKDGYLFTGWYRDPKCTMLISDKMTANGTDIALYAGWVKLSHQKRNDKDQHPVFTAPDNISDFGLSGVQIKIDDNYNLRFCSTISCDLYKTLESISGVNPVIGHVVAIKDSFNGDLLLSTEGVKNVVADKFIYNGADYKIFTATITDIPQAMKTTDIVVRPYIRYYDAYGQEQVYYYTENESLNVCGKGYFTNLKSTAIYMYNFDKNLELDFKNQLLVIIK